MRSLVADDNLVNRILLQSMLAPYGECHAVVNGREVIDAFQLAWDAGLPYDLLCLDIMMPEFDGQEVLRKIRSTESEMGIPEHRGVKVVVITALDDTANIMEAFRNQCEAYVVKPVRRAVMAENLRKLGLVA